MTILKDNESKIVAKNVKPDSKNRLVLPKEVLPEDITFHVYVNKHKQIILDPQTSIPLSKMWIYENEDILDLIDKGMAGSVNGKTINLGSFTQFIEDKV